MKSSLIKMMLVLVIIYWSIDHYLVVVVVMILVVVMVIIVASGFHGRPFPVTTNHSHPLTLQSTIPPFSSIFLLFILASSGFTPFFDPPTAVKEQQRMQDVGSDSGDSSGYLRIPATLQWMESSATKFLGIPTTLPCSYRRGDLLTDQGGCMLWIPWR